MTEQNKGSVELVPRNLSENLRQMGYVGWRQLARETDEIHNQLERAAPDFVGYGDMADAHANLLRNIRHISIGASAMDIEGREWDNVNGNSSTYRHALTEAREAGKLISDLMDGHGHIDRYRDKNGRVSRHDLGRCFDLADTTVKLYTKRKELMESNGYHVPSSATISEVAHERIANGWLSEAQTAILMKQFRQTMDAVLRVASKEVIPIPPEGFDAWLRQACLPKVTP